MQTIHLGIIGGSSIAGVIFLILSFTSMYPLTDVPHHTFKFWMSVDTPGLQDVYNVGQKVNFSVSIKGFGIYPCVFPGVKIYRYDNYNASVFEMNEPSGSMSCPIHTDPDFYQFYFPNKTGSFVTTLNRTGKYALDISYGSNSFEKYFSVIGNTNMTSTNDILVPTLFANATNTNFTINYNITGNNKLLAVNTGAQSQSLILSLMTTSDGMLTVSIPRVLLDSKSAYSNQDTEFIILVDKHEVKYTETTSITNRTLSIPLDLGAKEIEITATSGI